MKSLILILTVLIGVSAFAADENSQQALEGRDPVAYVKDGKAVRGDGFILSERGYPLRYPGVKMSRSAA